MNKLIVVLSLFAIISGCATSPSPRQLTNSHLNEAEEFANSGEWHKSIAALNTALEINPNDASALADRGFAKYKAGLPMIEALADTDAALSIRKSAYLFVQRCDLRIMAKMYKDAIEDCNQAIRYADAKGVNPDTFDKLRAEGLSGSINIGHGIDEAYARLREQAVQYRDLARKKIDE